MSPTRSSVLYVAQDDTVMKVSTAPQSTSGGRANAQRWGPVIEMSTGPDRESWTERDVRGVAVLLVLAASAVNCLGGGWWPVLAGIAAVVMTISMLMPLQRRRRAVVAPDSASGSEACRVLTAGQDRRLLSDALDVARRICTAVPSLEVMIDTPSTERALAQAIFDLAGLLERRQRLRHTRDDLRAQPYAGLDDDNPAVRSLKIQLDRVNRAMSDLDVDIADRMTVLERAANAGEIFISEEKVRRAIRDAEDVLAACVPEDLQSRPDSGAQLADDIEAVLAAYRELISSSGHTV